LSVHSHCAISQDRSPCWHPPYNLLNPLETLHLCYNKQYTSLYTLLLCRLLHTISSHVFLLHVLAVTSSHLQGVNIKWFIQDRLLLCELYDVDSLMMAGSNSRNM
jgi:hypothetical protein